MGKLFSSPSTENHAEGNRADPAVHSRLLLFIFTHKLSDRSVLSAVVTEGIFPFFCMGFNLYSVCGLTECFRVGFGVTCAPSPHLITAGGGGMRWRGRGLHCCISWTASHGTARKLNSDTKMVLIVTKIKKILASFALSPHLCPLNSSANVLYEEGLTTRGWSENKEDFHKHFQH